MTNTKFFTDGTADLPYEYAQRHDLGVIGLSFMLDGVEHIGDNNPNRPGHLPPEAFYARMRQGTVPTTSLVNQQTFFEEFEASLREGRDVFYLSFSSGLSGSYFNAIRAAEELRPLYPDRQIRVVDTLCASLGEGLMVHLALQQHEAGASDDEVEKYVFDIRLSIHHWFTVDDLVYLKRGGRVSGAAAMIGTMLSIKPVLNVDDAGHLIPKEKVQGRRRAIKSLVDHMVMNADPAYKGPVFISHCDAVDEAMQIAQQVEARFGIKTEIVNQIGPIVGAHSGPGTLALFFVGNKPRG